MNIVNSNHNKIPRGHHVVYILIIDKMNLERKNIQYVYYTNTYVEMIQTLFIKLSANGPR